MSTVVCPKCGRKYTIRESHAPSIHHCRQCDQTFRVELPLAAVVHVRRWPIALVALPVVVFATMLTIGVFVVRSRAAMERYHDYCAGKSRECMGNGDYAGAAGWYDSLVQREPRNPTNWLMRAQCKLWQANSCFEDDYRPGADGKYHTVRTETPDASRLRAEAEADLQEAVRLDPSFLKMAEDERHYVFTRPYVP